jgi:hypothetical protein
MMRRIIICIVLLFGVTGWSQQKRIVLDWEQYTPQTKSVVATRTAEKPLESTARFSLEENTYVEVWQDNAFAATGSARISNVTYETLPTVAYATLDQNLIPRGINFKLASSRARDQILTTLEFTPIINDNGVIKKVTAFDISYSSGRQSETQRNFGLTNSVLATGRWYQFQIDKTGAYRINRNFLNSIGMDVNNIDPRNIKIYSHGGNMLPYRNSLNNDFDPPEIPIQVVGEADGSFDSNDFILFYGETQQYSEESDTHINLYDNNTYYYITADGGPGKRIPSYTEPLGNADFTISRFHDYQFHEVDDFNPGLVGRRWFGNRFDINNQQSFTFEFPNLVTTEPVNYRILAIATSSSATSMSATTNGQSLGTMPFPAITSGTTLAFGRSLEGAFNTTSNSITVELNYSNAGNPSSRAFLDFISMEATRELIGTNAQFVFKNKDVAVLSGVAEYQLSNTSGYSQIWDITNPKFVTAISNENNAANISFKAQMGEARKYLAVHPGDYYSPIRSSQSNLANQNLKGTIFQNQQGNFQDIDYLIITSPQMIQPAIRLANHNIATKGLNVKVVTTDKIYNEFSTGKQDIAAIRNFIKYVYDNASSPDRRVKYIGMFGDTSVDYKNRLQGNNNIVPTFHHITESLSASSTYMSDDFYTMMDPNEGTMDSSDKMDIAIGRIIADDVPLANAMVNKIIEYNSGESYGNWRNNFLLISDDADTPSDSQLQVELDALGDEIGTEKPFINVIKIHSDAFQQQTSAGGNRYPEVNEAIKNSFEVGALVVNYFGHGGEDGLAGERIVTRSDVQSLRNRHRYPLMVTITCEFTRFDNPLRPTAGEEMFWNREGGAVAMLTTTRTIGQLTGALYNRDLASELFGYGTNDYTPPAEALRRAKNILSSTGRVIFYIGDPAMELAFPQPEVRITRLNGVPVGQSVDTLKALSKVRFSGEVVNENGNLLTNYNGVLEARVFDKRVQRQTLGNDGTMVGGEIFIMDFETLGEGIFNGQASVTNGTFEFEFVVPRDIAIPVGTGRVSLYSKRNNQLDDQTGYNETIKVGGINENAPEDNEGPIIQLFMNDETFINGGTTNDSPILIAKLEDENGINTASGIGHDIIAILDGDVENPIVLNEYYQADVDSYQKGSLSYNLRDLEEGLHTLTLRAWDVYNNSSTAEIQFVVAGSNELKIERVLNYPNPFVNYTEFWFNHNRPFEPLEVQVQVFTVTGKVVWTRNQIVNTDGFLSREIVWDGRDDFGDKIGKGVYVYKLTVRSTLTNQKTEKFEKLVIL